MPNKPKLLSLEFEHDCWSWGLVGPKILQNLSDQFRIKCMEYVEWRSQGEMAEEYSVILSQNATQMKSIQGATLKRTVMRLGGNRTFDKTKDVTDFYMDKMRQCFGVIATNSKLADIAKMVNDNVILCPNALDIDEWKPMKKKVFRHEKPVIGFVGNVSSKKKIKYKGFDLLTPACRKMGLTLKDALYKRKQIPHDKMMERFYYSIDVLVLPTFGEGCSNTIMEALACGIPVITTRTAGYHGDHLTDGENVLFCDRTVGSLMNVLRRLVGNAELFKKLSTNGRKFAIAHHDVKVIAEQYREMFTACLGPTSQKTIPDPVHTHDVPGCQTGSDID